MKTTLDDVKNNKYIIEYKDSKKDITDYVHWTIENYISPDMETVFMEQQFQYIENDYKFHCVLYADILNNTLNIFLIHRFAKHIKCNGNGYINKCDCGCDCEACSTDCDCDYSIIDFKKELHRKYIEIDERIILKSIVLNQGELF